MRSGLCSTGDESYHYGNHAGSLVAAQLEAASMASVRFPNISWSVYYYVWTLKASHATLQEQRQEQTIWDEILNSDMRTFWPDDVFEGLRYFTLVCVFLSFVDYLYRNTWRFDIVSLGSWSSCHHSVTSNWCTLPVTIVQAVCNGKHTDCCFLFSETLKHVGSDLMDVVQAHLFLALEFALARRIDQSEMRRMLSGSLTSWG